MITMMVVVKVRREKLKEFLQAMGSIQNNKNEEKGIRGSKLYQDVNDGTSFSLVDEWETDEDLGNHLGGETFKVLLGAVKILCTEAEVKYSVVCQNGSSTAKAFKTSSF